MWPQSSIRLRLENKLYDNSVLFWYRDWQSSNAAKQRGIKREKQRKDKIEVVSLYLSCPKLSYSAASGSFCQSAADFYNSQPLSPPFHFSVWAFIHLWVSGLKWLGWTQWEESGRWRIHRLKSFTIFQKRGRKMWQVGTDWNLKQSLISAEYKKLRMDAYRAEEEACCSFVWMLPAYNDGVWEPFFFFGCTYCSIWCCFQFCFFFLFVCYEDFNGQIQNSKNVLTWYWNRNTKQDSEGCSLTKV